MFRHARIVHVALLTTSFATAAHAQFNNSWVTFSNDANRIQLPNGSVDTALTQSIDEKHFAYGDFNGDGWTDLVVVTKIEASYPGGRRGFLLMNENGILVDRTAQYASDSDFPGSQGLLDLVNSRKVKAADVNGDGLLDLVTVATNLGSETNNPKYISHPRVYINKGFDANHQWLGFRYEESRIPALVGANGQLAAPHACSVAVGDVTGDGFPDLYVIIYHGTETGYGDDPNNLPHDVLLVNDGTGHFTDSGTSRMTGTMLNSAFGTECKIVDMNGDGVNDIVKDTTLNTPLYDSIAYNPPANPGFFTLFQTFNPSGSPYHIEVGDLNNDGKPDIVSSDDADDKYAFNTGNDPLGRVIWSSSKTFHFLTGGDGEFGSESHIVDLDGDGWNDVVISDFDHDEPGCGGRAHIYHNPGGAVGSTTIQLVEEAQQSGGGWRGVVGMLPSDLTGTFDEAVFDIDNDGDLDMVFGRCSGTFVWINHHATAATVTAFCPGDGTGTPCPCGNNSPAGAGSGCLNSLGIGGHLAANGDASVTGDTLTLTATQVVNSTGLYFQGTTEVAGGSGGVFGDGLRCAGGTIVRLGFEVNAGGTSHYPSGGDPLISVKGVVAAGSTHTYQLWYRNAGPFCNPETFNLTNGVQVVWAP